MCGMVFIFKVNLNIVAKSKSFAVTGNFNIDVKGDIGRRK
jgi:hypothetical protein